MLDRSMLILQSSPSMLCLAHGFHFTFRGLPLAVTGVILDHVRHLLYFVILGWPLAESAEGSAFGWLISLNLHVTFREKPKEVLLYLKSVYLDSSHHSDFQYTCKCSREVDLLSNKKPPFGGSVCKLSKKLIFRDSCNRRNNRR